MKDLWQRCLAVIKERINPQIFNTWFKPINLVGSNETSVELEVPNRFFLDWLRESYTPLILETLKGITHRDYSIIWRVGEEKVGPRKVPVVEGRPAEGERLLEKAFKEIGLNPKYTFENFVIGKSNEFAHAACFAVANSPSSKYNPLFIYGGVGLGKTHLLQAIGHQVLRNSRSAIACYCTSERFMNEFITSVRHGKMEEFRSKLRGVDILLIDDVQFWEGKEGTQEEFFHTFNALYESHKQIVVTSDRFPKDILGLEERLRNRFEWGLVADIQPPDVETRVAILKKKAEIERVSIPDDVALFIASVSGSNVRELEGYLIRVGAISSLSGKEITLAMAKDALKHLVKDGYKKVISVEDVQKAVANYFNIKVSDLKSKRRLKTVTFPRQVAMYLARECTNASFPEIGTTFGGKDHSTVIHAHKKIDKSIVENLDLKKAIRSIKGGLGVC
ncbi:MAG: chromosomal replication initiator protein DnaA [Deltaproteobacteria bacterium]|nr:chromosomal replication initiator protein DnaA [Deltaproteobacteria bacterium]